ncbi:MAG: methyltransferase domain-containing protein [Gammaproteobacteria bacterium]
MKSQTTTRLSAAVIRELHQFVPLLACPACGDRASELGVRHDAFICAQCKSRFPIYENGQTRVPWLFHDVEVAHLEWRSRYSGFLRANAAEQARLRASLDGNNVAGAAKERVLQLLRARESQRKQLTDLLAPLKLAAPRPASGLDRSGALHGKLPKHHGMSSYYDNVFRDWSWDNGENEKLFECVGRVLQGAAFRPTRLLTLGAGACRLSYDLHRHYRPALSVALDINPVLLFAGSRVMQGEALSLYEFPLAPIDKASVAVLRRCIAPEPLRSNESSAFIAVAADVLRIPFKPGSFDSVLTPWLIDVLPHDLAETVRIVNRALQPGGLWLNTGSLAFFHRNESWCYSEEEVLAIIAANGFELVEHERMRIPYLQSPASAHGRVEQVLSFSARKTADVPDTKRPQYLPDWLLDPDRPIPDLDELVVATADHLLKAQILGAVDGRRSIEQIALFVAKHYGLQAGEAKGAVQRILADVYESALLRKAVSPQELE